MKKRTMSSSNIGTVSLLMIFIVLCLVTFATLSLSNTVSDYHYSKKLAAHHSSYYEANNCATRTLSEIDRLLSEISSGATAKTGKKAYLSDVQKALEGLSLKESLKITLDKETAVLHIICPVSDRQELQIDLALTLPGADIPRYYQILKWEKVSISDWESDDTLHLMP